LARHSGKVSIGGRPQRRNRPAPVSNESGIAGDESEGIAARDWDARAWLGMRPAPSAASSMDRAAAF
jgi:hypothetical protein